MSDRLCAIQSGPARSASSGANLAVQASRCQGWTSKAGWRELLNHNDVSHADQSRCPRTGRLPTRPAESDPARVHCHMAHRRADDELLDWSNEHEPPPLPAVTRLCAGRDGRWRRPWPAAQDGVEPAARKSALMRSVSQSLPVTPRRRENVRAGCPPTPVSSWVFEPVDQSGAGARPCKGHALSLRARRSEFRFPTEAPGQPALS